MSFTVSTGPNLPELISTKYGTPSEIKKSKEPKEFNLCY